MAGPELFANNLSLTLTASLPAAALGAGPTPTGSAAVGGTTLAGTYIYRIVAKTAAGGNGLPSASSAGVTLTIAGTINLSWAAVPAADGGYDVYRTAAGGAAGTERLASVAAGTTTYADGSNLTPAGAQPTVDTSAVRAAVSSTTGITIPAIGGQYRFRRDTAASLSTAPYSGLATPEYVVVTAVVDGTHVTVARAVEGSTAVAWASGDVLTHVLTGGGLNALTTRAGTPGDVLVRDPSYTAGARSQSQPSPALAPSAAGFYSGKTYYAVGASCVAQPGIQCTAGKEYHNQVATALGMTVVNRSQAGSEMIDHAFGAIPGSLFGKAWGYTLGSASLVTVDAVLNDVAQQDFSQPAYQMGFEEALRYILGVYSSSARIAYASQSGGSFLAAVPPNYPANFLWYGAALNNSITWTGLTPGQVYYLGTIANDFLGNRQNAGVIAARSGDGTLLAVYDSCGRMQAYSSSGGNDGPGSATTTPAAAANPILYSPALRAITMPAGQTTLTVTYAMRSAGTLAANAGAGYVEAGLLQRAATPPRIIVLKPPRDHNQGGSYAMGTAYTALTRAFWEQANKIIDRVVSEFQNAISLDMATVLNPTMLFGASDAIHPTDTGMTAIANLILSAV